MPVRENLYCVRFGTVPVFTKFCSPGSFRKLRNFTQCRKMNVIQVNFTTNV